MLNNIILKFSTANVSDTSFEVLICRRLGQTSIFLARTHSMLMSNIIMNVSVSEITSVM